ncbi:MAG TPA: ATP-binding cassette domain-containing protein [Spirillospora sp.]
MIAALRRREAGWLALVLGGVLLAVSWPGLSGGLAPTVMSGLFLLFLAYAWNLVGGILGELSLSTMVFWAIGAYGLVLAGNADHDLRLAALAGAAAAALLGWLIVAVAGMLGLRGLYLAVFTLIIYEIARAGVVGVEALGRNEGVILTRLTGADTSAYLMIALVVLAIGVNMAVLGSRMGKRWLAVRDDVVAAEAVGVFSGRDKALAYALSAGLTALGGAVHAYYLGYAQPDTALGIELLIAALLAVYIGGPGTVLGPLLGTVLVYGLSAVATSMSTSVDVTLYAQLLQYGIAFAIIWSLSLGRVSRVGLVSALSALARRLSRHGTRHASSTEVPSPGPPPARPGPASGHGGAAPSSPAATASVTQGPGEEVLRVEGVSKRFGGVLVLDDVTLTLRPGEIVGLMGPNGAGKTTLCNVITGVVTPDRGTVRLHGRDLTGLSTPERFHRGVARTFQAPRLFRSLNVADNVRLGAPGRPERVAELLETYGLDGGMPAEDAPTFVRRLAEVARAVATDKDVLVLDEPLAGLTPAQHETILSGLREVAAAGTAVVLIEHLIQTVAPVCDRLVVLADGAIIADGEPSAVLRDDRVVDAYLDGVSGRAEQAGEPPAPGPDRTDVPQKEANSAAEH